MFYTEYGYETTSHKTTNDVSSILYDYDNKTKGLMYQYTYDANGNIATSVERSYAKKWFNSFNPEYYKYRYDCTNFVSQCLYAGGIPMSFGSDSYTWHSFRSTKWFFSPLVYISNNARYNWDVSAAWRLCAINYSYFKKSVYAKRVFAIKDTRSSVRASINKLKIGDLLYMDDDGDGVPNHAVIISSINRKKKKIYYAAHTNPHKKKDLEEYLKHRKHSKKKVLAIHIIDSF